MPEQQRRGRGHPPFQPTPEQREQVQTMRANGNSLPTIARSIGGIDVKTLRKHFGEELRTGREQVIADVGSAVVRAAKMGNMVAAKYWLSTHGGPEWRAIEARQIGGLPDAPPIPIDLSGKVMIYLPHNGREESGEDQ